MWTSSSLHATMRALVLVLLVAAATSFVEKNEWAAFKDKHGKSYVNPIEEFYRMKVYADNKAYVEKHNAEHAAGSTPLTWPSTSSPTSQPRNGAPPTRVSSWEALCLTRLTKSRARWPPQWTGASAGL